MPWNDRRAGWMSVARSGIGVGVILGSAWVGTARADRIMLRGGGQIRGKLIADAADPAHLTFVGEAGRKPIVYKKEQILQVVPEKSALDEYVNLLKQDRALPADEYQLGVWCEDHKLKDLAENHYDAALKLDPNFGPAHEKLGHVQSNDRWLTLDEQREAQGMVRYRGRWMMAEEKDRLEDQATRAAESQSWVRRIKIFRDSYASGQGNRAKDAERRLLEIREVAAVAPVARILGEDQDPAIRDLGGRVLGSIPGPESSTALVNRLLAETESTVREGLMAQLARREPEEVVPRLTRALKAQQAEVVNRAAWALGRLNAVAAVPQLIAALVFVEYRTEMVPVNGGGGGSGGIDASFSSGSAGGGVGFGSYTSRNYLLPTPPVVAPGAVAFGAVGVPLINGTALGNGGGNVVGGINVGGGGNEVKYLPRVVPIEHPNVEVREALTKLTNQDFGFNVGTWKRWASASFRTDRSPSRRVANP